jgi:DNA-binding protein Alba
MANITNPSVIFIGKKSTQAYIAAVITSLNSKSPPTTITLKARGKAMATAIDLAEIITKKYNEHHLKISTIQTDSEDRTDKTGKKRRVSTIIITLKK